MKDGLESVYGVYKEKEHTYLAFYSSEVLGVEGPVYGAYMIWRYRTYILRQSRLVLASPWSFTMSVWRISVEVYEIALFSLMVLHTARL